MAAELPDAAAMTQAMATMSRECAKLGNIPAEGQGTAILHVLEQLSQRIEWMDQRIGQRMERVEQRVEQMDQRMNGRFDDLETRIHAMYLQIGMLSLFSASSSRLLLLILNCLLLLLGTTTL